VFSWSPPVSGFVKKYLHFERLSPSLLKSDLTRFGLYVQINPEKHALVIRE
jgi:hypothetical protein